MGHFLLLLAEYAVFNLVAFVAVVVLPWLQNWLVFAVWGPGLAILLAWIHAETGDVESADLGMKKTPIFGIIVGVCQLATVSACWYFLLFWQRSL
jgi:hypothetical protein